MAKKIISFCLLSLLTIAACTPKQPDIRIESAELKLSPALVGVAAAFMTFRNAGSADTLLSAETDIPGSFAELHDIVDGKMEKVYRISVPSGSTVVLRPAREHIMIFKLPKETQAGSKIVLFLTFEKSGKKSIPVVVEAFRNSK